MRIMEIYAKVRENELLVSAEAKVLTADGETIYVSVDKADGEYGYQVALGSLLNLKSDGKITIKESDSTDNNENAGRESKYWPVYKVLQNIVDTIDEMNG